ncbi:MAG: hypothetical protein PHQ34_00425 [Methanothrix sp.]|nr:hypothetical protein [Methanothrix sp.]
MKRSWTKPKLTVLAKRSNPEDVLTVCKAGVGSAMSGPVDTYVSCAASDTNGCSECSSIGAS